MPVDAALNSASSVAFEAATLSAVLDAIRPASRLRLVILDACRVNPLAARMEVAGGLTRNVARGLGSIEPTGDVLVAYAAKAFVHSCVSAIADWEAGTSASHCTLPSIPPHLARDIHHQPSLAHCPSSVMSLPSSADEAALGER